MKQEICGGHLILSKWKTLESFDDNDMQDKIAKEEFIHAYEKLKETFQDENIGRLEDMIEIFQSPKNKVPYYRDEIEEKNSEIFDALFNDLNEEIIILDSDNGINWSWVVKNIKYNNILYYCDHVKESIYISKNYFEEVPVD